MEQCNKHTFTEKPHTNASYSHTWRCYIFVNYLERFRGQGGNVLLSNSVESKMCPKYFMCLSVWEANNETTECTGNAKILNRLKTTTLGQFSLNLTEILPLDCWRH